MTINEASERLSVSGSTVRNWIKSKKIQGYKDGAQNLWFVYAGSLRFAKRDPRGRKAKAALVASTISNTTNGNRST
jgi:excisionase family DNA binding protein